MNIFENLPTRIQGDVGLAGAVYKMTCLGYCVAIPLTDNSPYDLIAEKEGKSYRVQVKTSQRKERDSFVVQLRRIRVNTAKTSIHHFDNTKSDILFVLTSEEDFYMIPSLDIDKKAVITLNSSFDKYKV